MVTCPWCGTNYDHFISNCQKCGGPIPEQRAVPQPAAPAGMDILRFDPPPPAPRPISQGYTWRLLLSDGWAITGLVFALVGGIFSFTGLGLTAGVVTAFVGLPFVCLGFLGLGGGLALAYSRYQAAQQTTEVLRSGAPAAGRINSVGVIPNVRVNGRPPWKIEYTYQVDGQDFEGSVTTLNPPNIEPGEPAWILYHPGAPEKNSLYPHP